MDIAHFISATIASYLGNFLVNFIMNNATVIIFVFYCLCVFELRLGIKLGVEVLDHMVLPMFNFSR